MLERYLQTLSFLEPYSKSWDKQVSRHRDSLELTRKSIHPRAVNSSYKLELGKSILMSRTLTLTVLPCVLMFAAYSGNTASNKLEQN
ncbi:MAG: hypothetical protein H7095_01455 [Pseudopedobacter sp.]|nr:hypothetical protein [Deinococcales bacterium]